jgi:hypothetical protein
MGAIGSRHVVFAGFPAVGKNFNLPAIIKTP